MKLSNQQIEAIITNICSKQNLIIVAEKNAIRKDKKIISEAKKYFDILNQIPKDVRIRTYIDKTLSQFIEYVIETRKIKPKTSEIKRSELTNKIILASIDAKSLIELKTKLNIEF